MRRRDREVSGIDEIESVIMACDACRVSFADNNTPYIVTMNFGYRRNEIPMLFFHCAGEGKKIDLMKRNNYVCFEMDTDHELYRGEKGCDWGMKFRSVVGYGRLYEIKDKADRIKALDAIMEHYGSRGENVYDHRILEKTMLLRLEVETMTGKIKT